MNMKFLNTPIGNDTYVAAELNEKLDELREKVKSITDMPFKMEAFTLLRECLSQCRVVHLMRTIPPQQINAFLTKWDRILRKGFEKLIGSSLEDRWWAISRLNSKYGGIGLKSAKKYRWGSTLNFIGEQRRRSTEIPPFLELE